MRIIFNDFKKVYNQNEKAIDKAIKRVCKSGRFILGEEVKQFEERFASYMGSKYAIGVGNGLEALQISLMALGIGEGDEVITTAHSAVATALSIRAVGATPIFADIDEFYHINPKSVEQCITPKTKAIIPVHLYGQPCNLSELSKLAVKHKLVIIEDCAQAHGAEYNGKKVGTFGKMGCFSFYPTKNLGAFGDGGAIITDDAFLAEKCRMARNYGQKNRYEHEVYGINSRLDELQAAILSTLLPFLDRNNKKRISIAKIYRRELSGVNQIILPTERPSIKHVYHLFVIETEKRNELQKFLEKNGIDALIHYPFPIHKQKCFSDWKNVSLPITEKKVSQILSLPIHPYLTEKEVVFICQKIKTFFS